LYLLFREIIDLAAQYRPPAIYQWRDVDAGGLISYGPRLTALWRQAGTVAVKVLKGVEPADLPIEQPTKFELAVNARTAKSLGIPMQPSLLVSADDVIEWRYHRWPASASGNKKGRLRSRPIRSECP
jgi:putative ABC transport system substrate-binding protein